MSANDDINAAYAYLVNQGSPGTLDALQTLRLYYSAEGYSAVLDTINGLRQAKAKLTIGEPSA